MTVWSDFEESFSKENLKKIYFEVVIYSPATGIDKVSHNNFFPDIENQIEIINRKVFNDTYKFTKFKLKLINKGRGKPPREISIPTIRDRITLRALCEFLLKRYKSKIEQPLPQIVIRKLKSELDHGKYNSFIKLDVSSFYPNVRHDELKKRLGKCIRDSAIKYFILKAIKTPTVSKSKQSDLLNDVGVPQGLSISNILSSIYLINIDKHFSTQANIKYFRYVDDILILCNSGDINRIIKEVKSRFKRIGLTIHPPEENSTKSTFGGMDKDFAYLGYQFKNGMVSVRDTSIAKLKESLASILTAYKHADAKNINLLQWRWVQSHLGAVT